MICVSTADRFLNPGGAVVNGERRFLFLPRRAQNRGNLESTIGAGTLHRGGCVALVPPVANMSVELVMYSQCCGGNGPLEMEETTASRLDGSIGRIHTSRGI